MSYGAVTLSWYAVSTLHLKPLNTLDISHLHYNKYNNNERHLTQFFKPAPEKRDYFLDLTTELNGIELALKSELVEKA